MREPLRRGFSNQRARGLDARQVKGLGLLCGLYLALVTAPAGAAAPGLFCTAFVDVGVVDSATPVVQPHRTVVVRGERIEGVYPATHPVPSGCLRIAGRDRFLIPGLTDSHVHF